MNRALSEINAIVEDTPPTPSGHDREGYVRKVVRRSRGRAIGQRFRRIRILPPARGRVAPRPPSTIQTAKPTIRRHGGPGAPSRRQAEQLFDHCLNFFPSFRSSIETKRRFGVERILHELQRDASDYESYHEFFTHQENWVVRPLPEMNILDPTADSFEIRPECLLGTGGQGCVFLGVVRGQPVAAKIKACDASKLGARRRPSSRRSPSFRISGSKIEESSRGASSDGNFLNDGTQGSLHREAVAMFRVHCKHPMHPKPLLYGTTQDGAFEMFVMEVVDYTLFDFIRGTTVRARMSCVETIWKMVWDAIRGCSDSDVVHFDIKPENIGFKLVGGDARVGLLDFGISKTPGYRLDRFVRGGKLYRPPGTVNFMSPTTHLWKPMTWIDDYLSTFFTMYAFSTRDGKGGVRYPHPPTPRSFPVSGESRASMTPEDVVSYCLYFPPWRRLPYGSNHPLKKKNHENIIKEEISIAMLKIHAITSPTVTHDLVSVILNLDGFLDDTAELHRDDSTAFSHRCVALLGDVMQRQLGAFSRWWIRYAAETRKILDGIHADTPPAIRDRNRLFVTELLENHVPSHEEILGLIKESSYGMKLVEMDE